MAAVTDLGRRGLGSALGQLSNRLLDWVPARLGTPGGADRNHEPGRQLDVMTQTGVEAGPVARLDMGDSAHIWIA
ncbi:MAG: hypothetical protein ACRDGQ_04385 [Candidatus Limnocylindrales bacterium]